MRIMAEGLARVTLRVVFEADLEVSGMTLSGPLRRLVSKIVEKIGLTKLGGKLTRLWRPAPRSIQSLMDGAAELGIGIDRLEIQGQVAHMRIWETFTNSTEDFARFGQILRQQRVRRVVVDTGPIVAPQLAARYRSLAARGGTVRGGGRIRFVSEAPSSIPGRKGEMIPTFEIVFDLP